MCSFRHLHLQLRKTVSRTISRGLAAVGPLIVTPVAAMHPTPPLSAVKRILVVDFDGTCTIRDTTPLIPHLASSSTSKLAEFSRLEGIYFENLRNVQATMGLDRSPSESYDPDALALALATQDHVSMEVTEMVSQSRVLAGITRDGVESTLRRHV